MFRLTGITGLIQADTLADEEGVLSKNSILVHKGDFVCKDGPISFDEDRLKNIVASHNAYIKRQADGYGGFDKMPIGAFPPIYFNHEDEQMVIGRLNSYLTYFESINIPKVGKSIPAIGAKLTFLGKENVIPAKDGRFYHVSIGLKEDETIGEVSAVSDPAAPGANFLSRGTIKMSKDLIKKNERMEKLSNLNKEIIKVKSGLDKFKNKLSVAKEEAKLAQRDGMIKAKLAGLVKDRKMTPAEFKKITTDKDFHELSKLNDKMLRLSLMPYESREKPVVLASQYGSSYATDFSEIGKHLEDRQMKRLKSETIKDLKRLSGGKLSFKGEEEGSDEEKYEMSEPFGKEVNYPDKEEHHLDGSEEIPAEHMHKMKAHLHMMGKHLAEGDYEKVKECHRKLCHMCHMEDGEMNEEAMSHLAAGDTVPEKSKDDMNELQSQIDEINTQMARLAGMVGELVNVEEDEGHDLEGEQPEGMEPEGEEEKLAKPEGGNPFEKKKSDSPVDKSEEKQEKKEAEPKAEPGKKVA